MLRCLAFASSLCVLAACARGASEDPEPPPYMPPRTDAGPRDAGPSRDASVDLGAPLDGGLELDMATDVDMALDVDAGADIDMAMEVDLGADADAGVTVDLGADVDGGAPVDLGAEVDAGVVVDLGADIDAGPDLGVDAGIDAGPTGPCTGVGDCTPCMGGVCVAGACAAPPETLVYDFESGTLPMAWVAAGAVPWQVGTGRAYGGMFSARSGAIGNSQSSTLTATFTVSQAVVVSFWVNTETENVYDKLDVLVDGSVASTWSGTTAWTQASVSFAAGTHTILWRYSKDISGIVGADRVWIDDVVVRAAPAALGFEDGALPPGFTTSGAATWILDTVRARTGTYAAASGDIGNSQQSNLTRTVTLAAASEVSFWYTTSTETGPITPFDSLQFRVDGVVVGEWAGERAWARASATVAAGTHVLEWRFRKDGSTSTGADRVWIDDVVTGEEPPTAGPVCGG
jgi:hypothetical protein